MIKVFEKDAKTLNRRSSKGMQLKWESDHKWYKADSVALLKIVLHSVCMIGFM